MTFDPHMEYREKYAAFSKTEAELKAKRALQRIGWMILLGSLALTGILGYTVAVGLWKANDGFTRWLSLVIVNAIWVACAYWLYRNHVTLAAKANQLHEALQARQTAAAQLPLNTTSGLRVYREASLDVIASYRSQAIQNRRVHNLFQLLIISGSIIVSTLTAMNEGSNKALSIVTSSLSALVGISAGVTGYFKFRERGTTSQSTADDIEKNYNASQFQLGDYKNLGEEPRLILYAGTVELIKEEQRKRELQLEQSSSQHDERSA
ncbi:TRAP-type C4-dicarboxylate transport system permease small subunit [Streptomyces sp. V3I8]|nr:TRAP-type C4-dicarboxylate transport system permease small subunit [Streptomyces sp. V3I8]